MCKNPERIAKCNRDVCCCECAKEDCEVRCKKKFIEECVDFEEDID